MKEVRCPACKALLMKARVVDAEIKCRKCGNIVKVKESAK